MAEWSEAARRRCGESEVLALTQRLLVAPVALSAPRFIDRWVARIGGGGRLRPEGQHTGAGKQRRPGWPTEEGWTFHTYAALRLTYSSSPADDRGFPLLLLQGMPSPPHRRRPRHAQLAPHL